LGSDDASSDKRDVEEDEPIDNEMEMEFDSNNEDDE
jgi:hypothetical protein